MNILSIKLSDFAAWIDISIASHAKVPGSKCRWYCKPGAKLADKLRLVSNKLWRNK